MDWATSGCHVQIHKFFNCWAKPNTVNEWIKLQYDRDFGGGGSHISDEVKFDLCSNLEAKQYSDQNITLL